MINLTKTEWKKIINDQIEEYLCKANKQATIKHRKLRFLNNNNNDKTFKYIYEMKSQEVEIIMKARLNMLDLKDNYKSIRNDRNNECRICNEKDETTEHFLQCNQY